MSIEAKLRITANGKTYENPSPHYGEIRDFLYKTYGFGAQTLTSKEAIQQLAKLYHEEVNFLEIPLELTVYDDHETNIHKIYEQDDLNAFKDAYEHDNLEVYETGVPYPTFESLAFPFFTNDIHQLEGESDIFDGDEPIEHDDMMKLFRYLENLFAGRLLFGIEVSAIDKIEISVG